MCNLHRVHAARASCVREPSSNRRAFLRLRQVAARRESLAELFNVIRAPSTLGSFLRSFTWGNVLQVGKVSRLLLGELACRADLLLHGRRARRTIKTVLVPAWIEFDAPPRSRSCAARSPGTARRPSKSSTSSPATATLTPPPWPPRSAALGDGKPPPLGPGRYLPGRQVPGQDGKCALRDGITPQPGHQPAPPGRPSQHRRRQPPPRPRPAADATATSDHINDFAGSLRRTGGRVRVGGRRSVRQIQPVVDDFQDSPVCRLYSYACQNVLSSDKIGCIDTNDPLGGPWR